MDSELQGMLDAIEAADAHDLADIVVRLAALRAEECNMGPDCWKCAGVQTAWEAATRRAARMRTA
jgi:hypothetical protein